MITKKLLEFQRLDLAVKKLGANPHFKSSYATLNEVLAKVKKPLNDLGIVIIQEPQELGLLTRLIDTDDETQVTSFMPYVGADTAQKLGSANTYCRRYSLVTLLGLEDEDDDGEKASAPKVIKKVDPFEAAKEAILACTEVEALSKLAEQITASKKLTDDQKADLQDSLEARASLI